MRTLITGGAGFIGSHLCDFLVSRGHCVICVDNLITGQIANIRHLLDNENFKFIRHDVTELIPAEGDIDFVLDFASPASPVDYLRLPLETLRAGAWGTFSALEVAKERNAKFLLASTSEVYGDPTVNPQTEEYWGNVNPIGLRSVYDEAKRYAEALTMAYHRYYGLDTRIARIFNTYGPKMRGDDGRAIPTFIMQSLAGQPLTVSGDGLQTRSFCYISDLIDGLFKLMLSEISGPVNLGNPSEFTILGLAMRIIDITRSKSTIVHKPLPEDDPRLRRPDISRAQELLHWSPKVALEEGLEETAKWFKKVRSS